MQNTLEDKINPIFSEISSLSNVTIKGWCLYDKDDLAMTNIRSYKEWLEKEEIEKAKKMGNNKTLSSRMAKMNAAKKSIKLRKKSKEPKKEEIDLTNLEEVLGVAGVQLMKVYSFLKREKGSEPETIATFGKEEDEFVYKLNENVSYMYKHKNH